MAIMERNNLFRKEIIFVVILIIFSVIVIPATDYTVEKKSIISTFYDGNTLYVGGSGPGNYTKIQDAIDDASDGDTVFVYDDSSPYYENVKVKKSINLIGENRNTTIIDGNMKESAVYVNRDEVSISEFTLRNAGYPYWAGIYVKSDYNEFRNNIFINNYVGIWLDGSFNYASGNTIINHSMAGVYLKGVSNNVSKNSIIHCKYGVYFMNSFNNTVHKNIITEKCLEGIYIGRSSNNSIIGNFIEKNSFGILLYASPKNKIMYNNFIHNTISAVFHTCSNNTWYCNYWKRPRILPKPIFGLTQISILRIPLVQFDWHPALKPNDI